jgi:hypothetical protein
VGTDPSSVREGGKSALEYLAELQAADGHYRYSASSDQTPIWVTGQVLTATAGQSFPVAAPPREPKPPAAPQGGQSQSPVPVPSSPAAPPSIPGLPESSPPQGGSGVTPSAPGGGPPSTKPPSTGGIPAVPPPSAPQPEGAEPEPSSSAPTSPPFKASDNPGPKPWAPLGVGLASGGLALGSVLFFGRRFGW